MTDVAKVIRDHIEHEFLREPDLALADDTDLIEQEILDSLAIITLIVFLESQFGIDVEPADVTVHNFRTPLAIASLVSAKQPAAGKG